MQQPICDLCGDPTDGYVCQRCTAETAGYLRHVVDLASEVETNVARLARYATRGGSRAQALDEEDLGPSTVNRQQPVETFGWPASKDRPRRGALRVTALPVDLNAATRAAGAFNAVTTWARSVEEERGVKVPVLAREHPAAAAAAFLARQLEWIRHQPFADEANEQLRAAGATVRRIVDAPPELEVVGRCDCGAHLYARKGAATVTCDDCRASWSVEASRDTLIKTLREYLTTPSEAAGLMVFFGFTGDRRRSAKTIAMWSARGRIVQHGVVEGDPVFRFGDILDRAMQSQGAAA